MIGQRKNTAADIVVVGFALFSMFFGAGNVIFPPFLGMDCLLYTSDAADEL